MKKLVTVFCLIIFIGLTYGQQASDYFPLQTGFGWKFKVTPLDSVSDPVTSSSVFRIDSYTSVGDYKGKLANIIETKTGPLQTIQQQPFLDSLFYNTNGTDGFEYLNTKNIEALLITLDQTGTIPNFNFVNFFTSLQDWYSTYRFASNVNTEYTMLQKDTTVTISVFNLPLQFKYLGTRLQDQNLQTALGNFDCKKFLIQWKVSTSIFGDLLTLNDTVWIAPNNWIVQDIMPGQYVDNLTLLGIDPFAIPGLETKLTDELVSVKNEVEIPLSAFLEQNYPNPFNPTTKIKFAVPERSNVLIKIYDITGSEVLTLVNKEMEAGWHSFDFNANGIASGVYLVRMNAGNYISTKKMVLLR